MANQPGGNFLDFLFSDPFGVGAALFGPGDQQPIRGQGSLPPTTQQRTETASLQGLQPLDLQVDSPTGRTPAVQPGAPIPFGSLTGTQQASFSDPRFLPADPSQFSTGPSGLTQRALPAAPETPSIFGGNLQGDGAGGGGGQAFEPDLSIFFLDNPTTPGAPPPNVIFPEDGTPGPPLEFPFDRGQQFDKFSPVYGLLDSLQDLRGEFPEISDADFFAFLGIDPFVGGGIPAAAEQWLFNNGQFYPDAATAIRAFIEGTRIGLTEVQSLQTPAQALTPQPTTPIPAFDQEAFIRDFREELGLDDLFGDLEQLQQLPEELTPPGLTIDPAFRDESRGAGRVGL